MSTNVVIKSVFDDKGIRNAEKAFGGFGKTIKDNAGLIVSALGGAAVFNYAKEAVSAASALSAEFEGVNQTFGAGAAQVQKFAAEAANLVGVSETVALQAAKNFGGFATAAGLSGQAAASFSIDLVKAAGDLASFADVPVAEAIAAINSGLTGSAEPLQKFQIFLDAITLEKFAESLGKNYKTMTQGEKTMLRQNAILDQMGVKQGDFVNYQDTFGNSLKTVQAQFQDLQAEIGKAFIPALEGILAEMTVLVPVLEQELVEAINSADWEGVGEAIATFVGYITDNLDDIIGFAKALLTYAPIILGIVTAYTALKTVLTVVTIAQTLFNLAVLKNPYVIAAVAIITGITALAAVMDRLAGATKKTADETSTSTGEVNRFNNLKLDGIRNEINGVANAATNAGTAIKAMYPAPIGPGLDASGKSMLVPPGKNDFPLNPKPGQVFTWFKWEGGFAVWYEQTWSGKAWSAPKKVVASGSGSPKDNKDAESTADRFKKVQAVIKRAQKAIAQAEADYQKTRILLTRESEQRVLSIQTEFAEKRKDFIGEAVGKLTQAFQSASQLSLGDLFDKKTETKILTDVRRLSENLTLTVTKEVEKSTYSSIESVIDGLRKRLLESRKLLENASKLSAEGFSESFIQQVIETGAETGNELASAILNASPETRAEMRQLFNELETVSQTGMDAIAKQILDKSELFKVGLQAIQIELDNALIAEQARLSAALIEAGIAFSAAMADIKATFLEDLDSFDGWFAGLKGTIDSLLLKMKELQGTALTDVQKAITMPGTGTQLAGASVTQSVAIKDIANAGGVVIDSMADVAGTIAYLKARIEAGNRYITNIGKTTQLGIDAAGRVSGFEKELATLQGNAAAGSAVGTTININVKTDTTQSQAMVGKTIGNIVTKYVTTGGQVLVSGQQ
jgi:hypothetical protein